MTSKSLEILRQMTTPKSREEVKRFLIQRHGSVGKGNASVDKTALDGPARASLNGSLTSKPVARKTQKAESR
jgi:hypothetical protein